MKAITLENGNTLYYGVQNTVLARFAGFDYLEIVAGGGFTELSDEWDGDYTEDIDAQIKSNNGGADCDIFDYITVLEVMHDDFGIIDSDDYINLLRDCVAEVGEHLGV